MKNSQLWLLWLLLTVVGTGILVTGMLHGGPTRANLLIGKTTSGHHQIELACSACHTSAFNSSDDIEKTCHGCHDAELNAAKDSHPLKKFRDPRNADRLEKLAANKCITCHTEHRPNVTNAMGVTLPNDYCALCHQEVGRNRPSHLGLGFETCSSAGCHNYHDNTSIYEDFLEKHANEPDVKEKAVVALNTDAVEIAAKGDSLTEVAAADAPKLEGDHAKVMDEWLATSHANGGVNCSGCHAPKSKSANEIAANWADKPGHKVCAECHGLQASTWLQGKHGMRLADNMLSETKGLYGVFRDKPLTPMRPELARLPMQSAAAHSELTCTSCHSSHTFDTKQAAVASCTGCHADEHTKSYKGSPHHKLLVAELSGAAEKGTGVSCATCHMPRAWMEDASGYEELLTTNHNQNANLRPNEKMLRSVCMNCHGLGFSIDALADSELIKRNFGGRPAAHIESIDWVMKRVKEKEAK